MSRSCLVSSYPSLIRFGAAAFVLMAGLLLGTQAQAEVIYTENFEPVGGGLPGVGWDGGYGTGYDPLMSTYDNGSHTYGYTRANRGDSIAWTTEPGAVSTKKLTSISFVLGSDSGVPARVAVKIGTNWFATDTPFTHPGGSWGTHTFAWTTAAAAWRDLDFTPGLPGSNTSLSLGSVLGSDLPTGDVTAFGLFFDQYGTSDFRTGRFDTFQITAVPEPSSLVLLLALGGTIALITPLLRRRA